MPKPKIDRLKLNQLLRAGKTQREVAQVFGVTEAAISKAKKELNLAVVKNVALESAHKIVSKDLDSIQQLQKINLAANEILDLLMRWNRGDETVLQILETQVRKVRVGKKEKFVEKFSFKDPRELALRAMQEIRGQLSLQLDIFKTLYDIEAVREFQEHVLVAIGEEAPHVRDRIIERLKQGKALRGTTRIA